MSFKTEGNFTKSNLKLGQEMHANYKAEFHNPAEQMYKEFRLPSGKRIDFLDVQNSKIYELKPFNPRAMRMGQRQLQRYMEELQKMPRFKDIDWVPVLDTY